MQRVLIIGCPGSGKSVLARRLGAATGLPAVHLDRHFWGQDWTEPPPEIWQERLATLVAAPRWIIDGNYTDSLPLRLAAADTAIFLDFPTWRCLLRVALRALRWFGRQRGDDMAPGCRERIDIPFLLYVARFSRNGRNRVAEALAAFPGRVLVLRSSRDVTDFLAAIEP